MPDTRLPTHTLLALQLPPVLPVSVVVKVPVPPEPEHTAIGSAFAPWTTIKDVINKMTRTKLKSRAEELNMAKRSCMFFFLDAGPFF
jgi:hypothetical protein